MLAALKKEQDLDVEQLIGSTVREYYIQAQLGKGGMGTVLLAWHRVLREHRAVKIIQPKWLQNPEQEKAFRARAFREARLACRLKHPNLVPVLDCFEEHGSLFIVMEFVLGETLKERAQGRTLPLEETLSIVRQACLGMESAHSLTDDEGNRLGLVHRDLSPENLMVTADRQGQGLLKVIDFGIARPTQTSTGFSLTSFSVTGAGGFIGKVAYASPEQLCGMELDAASDIYSLGAVAYKLLCGQPPLRGANDSQTMYQRTTQAPPSLSQLSGCAWPVALDALLLKAVATKPEDRYQSMAEFREALDQSGLPVAPHLTAPNIERPLCPPTEPQKLPSDVAIARGHAGDQAGTTPLPPQESSVIDIDSVESSVLPEAVSKQQDSVPPTNAAPRNAWLAKHWKPLAALFAIVLVISAVAARMIMPDGGDRNHAKGEQTPLPAIALMPTTTISPTETVSPPPNAATPTRSPTSSSTAITPTMTVTPGKTATPPRTATPSRSPTTSPIATMTATTSCTTTPKLTPTSGPKALGQTGLLPMVRIEPGEFMMGSPGEESGRESDEKQHRVRITQAFMMGVTEVTQAQYETVMGNNPSDFKTCGGDCPVESVSWDEATTFCNRLSEREGLKPCYHGSGGGIQCDFTASGYRLPTEAEWEYACRAGSDTKYNLGNDEKDLERAGWYYTNSAQHTHPVRRKEANRRGLYDMHGNVWEWCWDWYGPDYYAASPASDPSGPPTGSHRVIRGGGWTYDAIYCRSANRIGYRPDYRGHGLGFRLVRSLP